MPKHHSETEIYGFITGDFQCAWDALAAKTLAEAANRGNFMFALQTTILLEWVSRLCGSDKTGKAMSDFAAELQKIEPRYFTELDGSCPHPGFEFPGQPGKDPLKSLLAAVWDLIRNGQAHHYQDSIVGLTCGRQWVFLIKGALHEMTLTEVDAKRSTLQHLDFSIHADGDLILNIHPGVFFLDIRAAAENATLLSRGVTSTPFPRGKGDRAKRTYKYDLAQLEAALQKGGLKKT